MLKRIMAYVLLGIALVITTLLLTYGGPVFPHISGPIVMAVIGAVLLLIPRKK